MAAAESTTVLIVAEHDLVSEAIRRGLRDTSACAIVGCVDARLSCATAVACSQPQIVLILDSSDPAATLARIRDAAGAVSESKLVLLTDRMDHGWLAEAAASGIDAAIARTIRPRSLATFLHEVARGNAFHTFEGRMPQQPAAEAAPVLRESLPFFEDPDTSVAHMPPAFHGADVSPFCGFSTLARLASAA